MPIKKPMLTGLIVLGAILCAAGSHAEAQAAKSRLTNDANGVPIPTEAFQQELSCLYETAGWDATMNFAEQVYLQKGGDALRETFALEIADCAGEHTWDAETQTLAYNTFLYAALIEYSIEQTGDIQLDSEVIFEIWSGLPDEDKAALIAADGANNADLRARTAALIRSKAQNLSDESVAHAQNALAAATLYASVRYEWSQRSVD